MIEFRDVVKSYDGVGAVDHLNLKVNDGELCVLLGASGCGKSTSLNMVNRLISPDSGSIFINGKNVGDFQIEVLRRSIGYVVQSTGLFPNMTVEENIAIVPRLLKWDKKQIRNRVCKLLTMVGLDVNKYLKKYPLQLSGGEAQRVGVARALAANPDILLMDEPFGAVDPLNRTNLQNEFLKLQKELGKTVIFVTHDIGEAMKMGDRIAVMSNGRLECYGTAKELLTNRQNTFVRNFLGNDSFINILNKYPVKAVMRSSQKLEALYRIGEEDTLKDALAAMIESSIEVLTVYNCENEQTGIVSIGQILSILKEV